MREIATAVDIAAPPETVWRVLTDFIKYPLWNPLLPRVVGQPVEGRRIYVEVQEGRRRMKFYARVGKVEPNRELRWKGGLSVDWLFDGEHIFVLEPLENMRTRLVHRERFTGLLVPLMSGRLMRARHGFEEMNRALKQRVEHLAA